MPTIQEVETHALEVGKPVELKVDDIVDGRYRIQRRLGRGGMGTVYESQQLKLQRQVALKVLHPEFASKALAAKRFEREAKTASSIDHRNVVKILDFGHLESGELYYTMELLEGRDLSKLLRDSGPLPWARAGWLTLQVARALGAIHDKGIVHRDVKPANCFLLDPKAGDDPDFVKLLDFGIANLQGQEEAGALTSTSDIIGSARYMAPEQVMAEQVDARTDIYSLGIMMYELLTGVVPFRETSIFKVMAQHKYEQPRPPRELVPEIPIEVAAMILRAIAKAPEDRFQSSKELELELVRAMRSTGIEVVPRIGDSSPWLGTRPPEPTRQRRRSIVSPMLGSAMLGLMGVFATAWWLGKVEEPEAMPQLPATHDVVVDESESAPTDAPRPMTPAPPPPLEQHDPYADPFGGTPLRDLGAMSPGTEGKLEEAPLEDLLPPEPWTLEPGRIAGRLLDDRGRVVTKGSVCMWLVDSRAPFERRRVPRCTRTRRGGRFELTNVVPGFYDVVAFAPELLPQSLMTRDRAPLTVRPGERKRGLAIALVRGGVELEGTVRSESGEPLASAIVAVVGSVRTLAVTDSTGAFSLRVAEGEIGVVASAKGYADIVLRRSSAAAPLDFVLRRGSTLAGKVVLEDGTPVEGARVRAGAREPGVDPEVYTDADGAFMISALPEGHYLPSARTYDAYGRAQELVTAPAGMILPAVVVQLRPLASIQVSGPLLEPPVSKTEAEAGPVVPAQIDEPEDDGGAKRPAPPGKSVASSGAHTDGWRLRKLEREIRRCGISGQVTLSAKYVLDTGALFQPLVRVTGAAAADPKTKECAQRLAGALRLLPRKSPSEFRSFTVPLE